jgi:hypothetical protein
MSALCDLEVAAAEIDALLTAAAFKHLGLPEPPRDPSQFELFGHDEDE